MAKVKCRYSHCLHDSVELQKEDAICEGRKYYHKDCYQTKKDIESIVDLFLTKVNRNAPIQQIRGIVNNIVFKRKVPSSELLFGIRYYLKNRISLNYPQGLYYVVANKDMHKAYEAEMAKLAVKRNQKTTKVKTVKSEPFVYREPNDVGLEEKWGIG